MQQHARQNELLISLQLVKGKHLKPEQVPPSGDGSFHGSTSVSAQKRRLFGAASGQPAALEGWAERVSIQPP